MSVAAATAPVAGEAQASARDWLAVSGAILGAFTAILDIQITNSSLANIEGALGASSDEGSWISTAYLMAEILVIPLTGWLCSVIGLRRYLATNTLFFVGFSVACALSTNLNQMILFRAGQGFTGGALIPTAIVIVRTRLPKSQQTIGIALFGLTATFAPSIGPTVGGWLTDNFSWHYIFYLNLLFGPIAAMLQLTALDAAPARWREFLKGDWIGIGFMAAGFLPLTFVLEEGQRKDWFGSSVIVFATVIATISITGLIIRELMAERPFINLRILTNRSVGGSCILMAVLGASALSNMMRNLGGSIGIATLSTMIDRREHFHFSMLAEAITVNATHTQERLVMLAAGLHDHVTDPAMAKAQALAQLAAQVRREAYVMAYADGFYLVGVCLVLSLGAVALLRKPQKASGQV
jgi:MFS transporter, DHA2 family, multidrug resistance protein